jgi:hypothetical protein
MKKLILLLSFINLSAFCFADDSPAITNQVLESFKKDFTGAAEVQWEQYADEFKATFTMNMQVLSAYYNYEGELLFVKRNISSPQLPLKLLMDLKKRYSEGYWIGGLVEITSGDQSTYFLTLQNADEQVVLKSKGNGTWKVIRKDI